jgi:DNA-binding SARP family transcriptional activator/tetratricopeptide (TPR) repeat protein
VRQRRGHHPVEFRLLGPVEVVVDGRPVVLGPPKRRLVLALLLLEHGACMPVDRLVELAWEEPPAAARRVVFAHVARLRKAIAGAGAELVTTPPGYTLEVEPDQVDVHRFRRLVDAASAVEDPLARSDARRAALALWRGPVLDGLDPPGPARRLFQVLDDLRLTTTEDRFDDELTLGRHHTVLADLAELAARHPLRERLAGQLMLAQYRSGNAAEALAVYRRTRTSLATELGVDPDPELDRLHAAILRRDPAAAEPPVPAPSEPAPPPPPAAAPPRMLPRDVVGFIGRDGHLRQLDALLPGDGPAPVVMITGLAGTGKSALAVRWAHRVADQFPDGCLYLDLDGYRGEARISPARALAVLLRALGVPPDQVPAEAAEAGSLYRSALSGRRVLIVLDNVAGAGQARPLLPAAPGCMAVTIGRTRLDGLIALDQAHHVPLGVLTGTEAVAMLARFAGRARVDADREGARRLAGLCGYLPLALAIAGTRLATEPDLTLAEHARALADRDRLSALSVDDDEHAAVRGAFAESYRSLPAELRVAFQRLGLHPVRTVGVAAAAILIGTDEGQARDRLHRLARFSMVDPVDGGRYALHDLLHLFARELAAAHAAEEAAGIRRLSVWYLHAVDAAVRRLYPSLVRLPVPTPPPDDLPVPRFDDDATARQWLEAERDAVVAVVAKLAADGPQETVWLLADAIRGHLRSARHLADLLAVSEAADRAARDAPPRIRANTRLGLSNAHRLHGDLAPAIAHCREGLALCRRAGWVDGEAAAHGNLGNLHLEVGELDLAIVHYERSADLFQQIGHRGGQATSLGNIGAVHRMLGRLAEAGTAHTEALRLHRAGGSRSGEALALAHLGVVQHLSGRLGAAHTHLVDALGIFRRAGDRAGEAGTLDALAAVHRSAGRLTEALEHANAAVDLARAVAYPRTEADALNTLGEIWHAMAAEYAAIRAHHDALHLARRRHVHHRDAEITALLGLVAAHDAAGRPDLADGYAREAQRLGPQSRNRMLADRVEAAAAATAGSRTPG